MQVPHFDPQQAQHYLTAEVVVGSLLIVFDGLAQGEFPGPMAYFPFVMTFMFLSLLAMITTLSTAMVFLGAIIVVMLFLAPSPLADTLSGQLFFQSIGNASNSVATTGASKAQGYGG